MAPTVATASEMPSAKAMEREREEKIQRKNGIMQSFIEELNQEWCLELELPSHNQSPSTRANDRTLETKCVSLIKIICYKDDENYSAMNAIMKDFQRQADEFFVRWVKKPKAERGVVPNKTRRKKHPVTFGEKQTLLECLRGLLDPVAQAKTPRRIHRDVSVDDTPVPFPLSNKSEAAVSYPKLRKTSGEKRAGEDFENITPAKKAKANMQGLSTNPMPPPEPGRGWSFTRDPNPRSNNTSFTSNASRSFTSNESSVFSQRHESFPNTQETVPDEQPTLPRPKNPAFTTMQPDKIESSDYTSSSYEARVADVSEGEVIVSSLETDPNPAPASAVEEELSQELLGVGLADETMSSAEHQLHDMLDNVFLTLPSCLKDAPLPVVYEITRVFLHVNIPISEFNAPVTDRLQDYDNLWKFLSSLPQLRGLTFPEKCAGEVWKAALDGFEKGAHCVTMAGKLTFNTKSPLESSDPLFRVSLEALKLDESHRIDRRWGSDRSLELQMPDLTSGNVPAPVTRLQRNVSEERFRKFVLDWLVDTSHQIFGRRWKPFCSKRLERSNKKRDGKTIRIDALRPTKENDFQTYLKLFNRTVLALSRNQATLVLEENQILRRENNIREEDIKEGIIDYGAPRNPRPKGPVMNDGAGRISRTLASKVKDKLALSYLPSAFQGRLGGAKGLWVVDHSDHSDTDWIEVYPSQQKWDRRTKNGAIDDHSQRTFEVNGISGPLKPADLNAQFLPLLVNGARDKNAMKAAISSILKSGLQQRIDDIQAAIDEPESFRKYIRESNPNSKEKLKVGGIPCTAGLPTVREERLNMLLDAGFHPKKLQFMKEQALKLFTFRTDDLKEKMNITVRKSCFPYMVPDFWGVLAADEVYIDFSNFRDDNSGLSGVVLRDDYVLVARSPAHYPSDIQKVKAVVRPEFLGLKDVIVFPIKGNPSLADKLSGGDYDGDRAWVCWEKDIVDNFENTEVKEIKSMVEQGYLTKDARVYKDVVKGYRDPVSIFLKEALDFNMRPSMLGICTNFKDSVFYTVKDASHPANMALCRLLSDLVDQAKNGYGFTEESWKRFKKDLVNIKVKRPAHASGVVDDCRRSDNVLDHLTIIAHEAIEKAILEFHMNFGQPPSWDDDLVTDHEWASKMITIPGWKDMLVTLKADLTEIKNAWSKYPWTKAGKDESSAFKSKLYHQYQSIRPQVENVPGRILLGPDPKNDLSQWNLLKASTLFASYKGRTVSNLVWWMSAKQLCSMKAIKSGSPHSIIPRMYILLKPDNSMIRKMQESVSARNLEDMASVVNVDELDDFNDD